MTGVASADTVRRAGVVHDAASDAALEQRHALARLTFEIEGPRHALRVEWILYQRDRAGDLLADLPSNEGPALLDRETGEVTAKKADHVANPVGLEHHLVGPRRHVARPLRAHRLRHRLVRGAVHVKLLEVGRHALRERRAVASDRSDL